MAYTGARRGEIGKLEKSQIKFDEDSQRYYFLIAEGGQGKTENATRQVVIHPKLIEWGFMEFVDRQWKDRIFSAVAGTNMTKIGKVFADVRDQLGIPYLDDYGQRRLLHSIRHWSVLLQWLVAKHPAPTADGWAREERWNYQALFAYISIIYSLLCDRRVRLGIDFQKPNQNFSG